MNAPALPLLEKVPRDTIDWLLGEDNPAVGVLTRRALLGESDTPRTARLWKRRNDYPPVAAILDAMREDGSWDVPSRDYQKYRGSLWQVHFLGELHADPASDRVQRAAAYAFSRQVADGSWSCNGRPAASIPCLTANVGRALARLGFARDERVVSALAYCVRLYQVLGRLGCGSVDQDRQPEDAAGIYTLNGYCHMLAPKLLLFLAEVPADLWPDGADALRDECVSKLREKQVFRSLPAEGREFFDLVWSAPAAERPGMRERFLEQHPVLHYKDKSGWLRFGYPLSYNSDVLEALRALASAGETRRPEYGPALEVVESAAGRDLRWLMRNSLNGKMFADVEAKGAPSKWLTLHALGVLAHFRG